MKFLIVLSFLACICPVASAQHIIRVHAFFQEIMPGVAPAVSDGEVVTQKRNYDYQVYVECKRSVELKLNSIRLKRKLFAASLQEVKSPVVQFHPTILRRDTLIRKTPNKLLKVVFDKELTRNSRDTIGVVLSYSVRGKPFVYREKKFKELAPIAMP